MSDIPEIPRDFTLHLDTADCFELCVKELPRITLDGDFTLGLNDIRIKELPKIEADLGLDDIRIKELPKIVADVDLGLDDIRVKELPVVRLKVGLDPTRVHLPGGWKFGVSVLGLPVLSFDVCGESMVVIEDYHPHKTEKCD